MRRRWLVAGVLVLGAAAVTFVAVARHDTPKADAGSTPSAPSATANRETAKVTRTDLVDEQKLGGTLGYGEATTIGGTGQGTITDLPEPGTVLKQGDSVFEVDDHPGPAVMYGDLPLWRVLRSGMTRGADVTQLEQNLTDLGFGSDLTVDDTFDSHTSAAIKAWQDSRGLRKTGMVAPGDVVIEAGPVRVAEQRARIGDQLKPEILTVTAAQQIVSLDVTVDKLSLVSPGAAVKVQLPDDSRVDGAIASIGRTATAPQGGGSATVAVTVSLVAPVASLDTAPVDVVVTTQKATGVLVVPIRALLAVAEGGYAVEKVDGASTHLVAVKLGVFGDGVVEVKGDGVAEGDDVVVAP